MRQQLLGQEQHAIFSLLTARRSESILTGRPLNGMRTREQRLHTSNRELFRVQSQGPITAQMFTVVVPASRFGAMVFNQENFPVARSPSDADAAGEHQLERWMDDMAQAALAGSSRRTVEQAWDDGQMERNWLESNCHEYAGQWVALNSSGKLVSHGSDSQQVYQTARSSGVRIPSVFYVNPEPDLPFGGW